MTSTVTVSLRSLVVTTTVIVALVGAYTVGSARADAGGAQGAQPVGAVAETTGATGDDAVFVRGTGEATGVPDQLRFTVTARATADDVSAAVAEANATSRKVLAALRGHQVARRDVQTTGLSIHPVYDYSDEGPPRITGYAASERFSVLVRDLAKAGEALSAAVDAGGNAVRLNGVRLQIGDQEALLREARAQAFAEAKAKAEQYARAAGRELGELTSVREGVSAPRSELRAFGRQRALADLAQVPIRAGSEELEVSVSLVWAFA